MPRETLKLGVIGLGEFGEAYLQLINGLRDVLDIETVAIASRSADRAADLADRFAIARWYDDSVAFANDPDIDVVCVVTSEPSHADPATRALYAGKHVIVEKPIATTLADADAMIAAAEANGRQLLVGQILRFAPIYQGIVERAHAGALGEIVSIQTRRNRPAIATQRYRRTHPMLETGILDLDVMLWLTRSRVQRVTALSRTIVPGPTPDLIWAMLEFDSGAIGVLETSWLGPSDGIGADDALHVIGSEGTARLDLSRSPAAIWTSSGYEQIDAFYAPGYGGELYGAFRDQLIAFITAIRTGLTDLVPLDEVRHGLRVALAIIESSQSGRPVTL